MLIVDTGPLVALGDASDPHHSACAELLETDPGPLVTTALVIAEAGYMLARGLGPAAELALIEMIRERTLTVEALTPADCLLTGRPTLVYGYSFVPDGPAAEGLNNLRQRVFGGDGFGGPIEWITEGTFPLPPGLVTGKRKGCSPDWVVRWIDSTLIVEFKTKASSMSLAQVEEQLAVMRWHHPDIPLLHLYVTPVVASFAPRLEVGVSYQPVLV